MTQIVDLTWQQIETASDISNLLITDSVQGLLLRLSVLTQLTSTDKNSKGVIQALYKLREFAAKAQITANTGQQIGERLAAFPPKVSGSPVNGYVIESGQIITRIPISTSGVIGANN